MLLLLRTDVINRLILLRIYCKDLGYETHY